jgi:ribose 5-phosphate isomerase A
MTIGLGTGSTVYYLIQELGKRVQQGLQVTVVPTSKQTETLAKQLNIPLEDLNDVEKLALTIDGADEVDTQLHLIKGGGGALLQEKIVAGASEQLIIIVDSSKMVRHLGKFPLPVEVITFGYKHAERKILSMGCSKVVLRQRDNKTFITDHGHYILDCYFEKINDPASLNTDLHNIPGVVETGLFINMATKIIIASAEGKIEMIEKRD